MGIGDEIIASSQARRVHEQYGVPVLILDARGRPRWHPIWDHNPRILRTPHKQYRTITNGPNARPYVAQKTPTRWTWRPMGLQPGEIHLTAGERAFAAQYAGRILVEPNVKGTNEGNKDWGFERWQEFARHTPNLLQVGRPGTRVLDGVEFVETPDFRLAAAVLAVSRAYVGTEGGLHHAAAALGRPAVVIFGGFISPDITGYAEHRNLFSGGRACGARTACSHCRDAMARIGVDDVRRNLEEIL